MKGKDEEEGLETVSSTNPEPAPVPAPAPAPEENPNSGCMYHLVRERC